MITYNIEFTASGDRDKILQDIESLKSLLEDWHELGPALSNRVYAGPSLRVLIDSSEPSKKEDSIPEDCEVIYKIVPGMTEFPFQDPFQKTFFDTMRFENESAALESGEIYRAEWGEKHVDITDPDKKVKRIELNYRPVAGLDVSDHAAICEYLNKDMELRAPKSN